MGKLRSNTTQAHTSSSSHPFSFLQTLLLSSSLPSEFSMAAGKMGMSSLLEYRGLSIVRIAQVVRGCGALRLDWERLLHALFASQALFRYSSKSHVTVNLIKESRHGGGALVANMNLFDRFSRVVKSYANAIISSFEDLEKILEQAVLEMNDDLIKMRQAMAQKGEIPAGRTISTSAKSEFPFRDMEVERELNELRKKAKDF